MLTNVCHEFLTSSSPTDFSAAKVGRGEHGSRSVNHAKNEEMLFVHQYYENLINNKSDSLKDTHLVIDSSTNTGCRTFQMS